MKIPESYLTKKDYYIKEGYTGLTKSKSKQSARELNTLSGISNAMKENSPDKLDKLVKTQSVVQSENPTILKLNSIFNSLFGKRSKMPMKTYSEGMLVHHQPPKENKVEMPDISCFKERVENEI